MTSPEMPGYWRNETSGILQPAVERYFSGEALSAADVAALRAYLRQWITEGDFLGVAVQRLRETVDSIECRFDIWLWTHRALKAGIDPW